MTVVPRRRSEGVEAAETETSNWHPREARTTRAPATTPACYKRIVYANEHRYWNATHVCNPIQYSAMQCTQAHWWLLPSHPVFPHSSYTIIIYPLRKETRNQKVQASPMSYTFLNTYSTTRIIPLNRFHSTYCCNDITSVVPISILT